MDTLSLHRSSSTIVGGTGVATSGSPSMLQQSCPMSISAITTAAAPIFPPSPPPSSNNNKSLSRYISYDQPPQLGSPPTSPDDLDFSSPPTSPYPHSDMAPLTLQERRMRNKTASAKYRQKKNQQQGEMRQMICALSEKKAVLERQVQELRMDNERLRAAADSLRGKMVAQKMLRQWMSRHHQRKDSSAFRAVPKSFSDDDDDDDGLDFDLDDDVVAPV